MADSKISGLTQTLAYEGDDDVPVSDVTNTSNKRWPITAIGGTGVNDQSGATYTILASDRGKTVRGTGTAATTFTTPAAATVKAGWWCYIENALTGASAAAKKLTVDGNASETVDGATTIVTYPGDLRILFSDGTNWLTKLLKGGYIEIAVADSPYTLTIPSTLNRGNVEMWGAGGGGGSGRVIISGTTASGGSGGGGGAWAGAEFAAAILGTSITVTIGAGGTGGAGVTTDATNGNPGGNGGNSTFGSLLTAYAGGGGSGGLSGASNQGGAGGGILTAAVLAAEGAPSPSDVNEQNNGFGGSDEPPSNTPGRANAFGGASGGSNATGVAGVAGGSSFKGGAGGGSGGGVTAAPAETGGGAGGSGQGAVNGGGGVGGGVAAAGGAGTNDLNGLGRGTSGGGGGSEITAAGVSGAGGAGGTASGGGGSGAALNGADSGVGGEGGAGLCRFRYS